MVWKQYLIVEREKFSLINANKVENFSRDHLTHDDNDVVVWTRCLLFLLRIKMNEIAVEKEKFY